MTDTITEARELLELIAGELEMICAEGEDYPIQQDANYRVSLDHIFRGDSTEDTKKVARFVREAPKELRSLLERVEKLEAENKELREGLGLYNRSAYPVSESINPRGYNWSEAYLDQARTETTSLLEGE